MKVRSKIVGSLVEAGDDDPMWMSKLAPKLKKGQLHRDLGIPQDETIPTSKLHAAAAQGGKVAQRANFALRARGESIGSEMTGKPLREEPARWEVYVGNIGRVYTGTDGNKAKAAFEHYSLMSVKGEGRAAGESVTLMMNDEIVDEWQGRDESEDG
jgi:hypothetical protein